MEIRNPMPGVYHLTDCLGVSMTLLVGASAALLVDTGYGLEDVAEVVRGITPLPVAVLLTHGHHDHALGAWPFPRVRMLAGEAEVYRTYTGESWRRHVLSSAAGRGIAVDAAAYLGRAMPPAEVIAPGDMNLGGLTARVMACPGHTPGSAVVYVPERSLLLTGDDWNPCTWLFFPEALGVGAYRANMRRLLTATPFRQVLCAHQSSLYGREAVEAFLAGLTDEAIRRAQRVTIAPYEAIDTRQVLLPEGQQLVFDGAKAAEFAEEKEEKVP